MREKFQPSAGTALPATVLLTICLIGPAEAGGLAPSAEDRTRPLASQCGETYDGCTRIRGHVPAASVRAGVETIGDRPATLAAPPAPFVVGLGAVGQAAADALNRLFLEADPR